ncbi:hypothetical protein SARC_06561 [Sphaeroforma arctica JP610]|uniref:Uncharacterized protein n=1 Tax=Sphaeroforma arctica JP610 TaxID=667725 RepID=A0A0L0FWA1_9EUKA|nr:hypothetical protein SARC_06561 [Sphaeroforma arctica JP610]KNC81100.1 hypothetical protein SARC_06561 [Sphaeroforma arctica JP610]|eukprot:XP_014155002.1 hypothetical protein SARC_06561 [Sphaeroforma arctica JP610]
MLANDSHKFYELMPLLNLLWAAPLQIAVATFFLIRFLGVSALSVKFFSWEIPYVDRILAKRAVEMGFVSKELFLSAWTMYLLMVFPMYGMLVTFVVQHQITPLNSADTFAALSFFSILKYCKY